MKKLLLVTVFAALFSAIGSATPLDFTSLGSLNCGVAVGCAGGGPSITFTDNGATITITYSSNSETNLNVPLQPGFSVTNFGQLQIACTVCSGLTAVFNLAGATLDLGVSQGANPFVDANPNMFLGTFSGTLNVTGGTSFGGGGIVAFTPLVSSLVSGPLTVNYYLQQPVNPPVAPGGYLLSIGNATTLQGIVDTVNDAPPSDVPEPRSMVLMSVGLFALGFWRRGRLAAR